MAKNIPRVRFVGFRKRKAIKAPIGSDIPDIRVYRKVFFLFFVE
jgi:hypothetical protein